MQKLNNQLINCEDEIIFSEESLQEPTVLERLAALESLVLEKLLEEANV